MNRTIVMEEEEGDSAKRFAVDNDSDVEADEQRYLQTAREIAEKVRRQQE